MHYISLFYILSQINTIIPILLVLFVIYLAESDPPNWFYYRIENPELKLEFFAVYSGIFGNTEQQL